MTIGCTRCGAQEDGNILSPPIAFAFKHNPGCGHGLGPLAVIPGSVKAKKEPEPEPKPQVDEVKVEEKVEENKPKTKKKQRDSQ